MTRFRNQTVLITGASGGLGRQLALDFAAEGANVVLNYARSQGPAEKTAEQIVSEGGQAEAIQADIADKAKVEAMVARATDRFGSIDILINNAGLSLDAPFLDMTEDAWDKVIAANLKGPFLLSQAVGRLMVAAGKGRIVNISATTAVVARRGNANYAAAKAGLNMLTQAMALELGPHVTVNAVALGFVDSPLVRDLFSEDEIAEAQASVPVERMTTYSETSDFVRMLASDTAAFVTGQTIPFDGGRVMR